jgi:hypothetical protein
MRVGLIMALVTALSANAAAPSFAAPTTNPSAKPTTAPAWAEPPASTPREALRSLNIAQRDGDAKAICSLFLTEDELGARLISAMADYAAALVALHRAAEKAYGLDGANVVTGDINAQSSDALAAIEKAEIMVTGDKASVKYAGAKDDPVHLIKAGNRWKLPLADLLANVDKDSEQQRLTELRHQAQLASEMANELSSGKYKEGPSRASAVWRSRLLDPATSRPTTREGK